MDDDPVKIGSKAIVDEIEFLHQWDLISNKDAIRAYTSLAAVMKIISEGREKGHRTISRFEGLQ